MTMLAKHTILVVDDVPENIAVLSGILRESYRVQAARTGERALELASSAIPPDLILLDIIMPEMDGYEVCRRMKSYPGAADIPVIFISALDDLSDKILGFEAGGVDYITKPFQPQEVLARVNTHLTLRKLRQQLELQNLQLKQAHEQVSRALEQEKELNELKSRFLALASHEFRSPLAAISISAQLLEQRGLNLSEEKRLKHLKNIQKSVNHLSVIVDDVLLVEQGKAGLLQFNPQPFDLVAFCQNIIEQYRLGAGSQHDMHLIFEGLEDPSTLTVWLDAKILRRILRNLLSNAVKYSPAGSQITLSLTYLNGRVRFRITDEGIGIPAKDQARLFEFFHRAGNVGEISGSGLGLYIVKQAVELHEGTIDVESDEHQGATFIIELPEVQRTSDLQEKEPVSATQAEEAAPETFQPRTSPSVSSESKESTADHDVIRILIADDHAVVRQGLRLTIGDEAGMEVVGEAADGLEAVEKTRLLRPDVLLIDLVMPQMAGLEAITEIKREHPQVHILVLTGSAQEDMVFPAIKAGALGYLLKDAAPSELVQAIKTVNQGQSFLHPTIARMLVEEISHPPSLPPTDDPLTPREMETLRLVAQGLTNDEIAEQLVISQRTVRNYVTNILSKLHLANRVQAALYALREGIIE